MALDESRRRIVFVSPMVMLHRDVWRNFTAPGTFRKLLRQAWHACTGSPPPPPSPRRDVVSRPIHDDLDWCITESDLQYFQRHAEDDTTPPGYSDWELMTRKTIGDQATYTAWRRTMPSGKTEYKSVTVARDASPEEFNDFFLDDGVRAQWDSMLTSHESVARVTDAESAPHRLQVVHWKRSFPFSFISARDYVIGRRTFRQPGVVYGITKAVEHADRPPVQGVVRMVTYHSMWRCRAVACPFGSDTPACETLLLHHEDFQIPENLARFAVRAGMGGFIKKMVPAVEPFVSARRQRLLPHEPDAHAFGLDGVCMDGVEDAQSVTGVDEGVIVLPESPRNANLRRIRTAPASLLGTKELARSTSAASISSSGGKSTGGRSSRPRSHLARQGSVHKLATLALAAGVAVAMSQTSAGTLAKCVSPRRRR